MRTHVLFDTLWSMPIEVPYSYLLQDGALGWTCGQVPLDAAGAVLHPGDLVAQADVVCEHIARILERGGIDRDAVGKLLVYYVEPRPGDGTRMLDAIARALGPTPLIVPVRVPYFYYDGLLIEIDVFTSTSRGRRLGTTSEDGRLTFDLVDGGDVVWGHLTLRGDGRAPLPVEAEPFISRSLAEFSLEPADLLSEHWYVPGTRGRAFEKGHVAGYLKAQGWFRDPGAAVMTGDGDVRVHGEITYVRGPGAVAAEEIAAEDGTRVTARSKGDFLWLAGRCGAEGAGLVDQTRRIMEAFASALDERGMGFADVVKSTTHYTGEDTPEDLHDNMAVRNARYTQPGPASTGLPVLALGAKHGRTAIDITAIRRSQT